MLGILLIIIGLISILTYASKNDLWTAAEISQSMHDTASIDYAYLGFLAISVVLLCVSVKLFFRS